MSIDVIKSYLVRLGFETDQPTLVKFEGALHSAESVVASTVGGILGDFLKFQVGAIGAFSAVGFGVVGFVDKLAMSDQQMRLFAMRSFMTVQQARSVQTALKVLGVSLEDVAWDKELHKRFQTLIQDQRDLSKMIGPQYEQQMMDVRDVMFQLQRLEVKGEYFGMKFASDLLKKLGFGDGSIVAQLEKLNDWVMKNMPRWADELSTDIIPVLKDFWEILKGLGHLAEDLALEFTNLVALFSGDTGIAGETFNFHKFAAAVEHVVHWVSELVQGLIKAEQIAARFAPVIAGIAGGAGVGAMVGGVGAVPGAVIGGLAGLGTMIATETIAAGGPGAAAGRVGSAMGNTADQARQAAAEVSAKTGIPADLVFAQWAHETGGFKNRGTTELNNLAGIRYSGSKEYRKFDSVSDFADFYARLIESKRYTSKGINEAKTPEAFAHALKAGSYYEGPESVYAKRLGDWRPQYAQGGGAGAQVTIGSIPVTVNEPHATPAQIQRAVAAGAKDAIQEHTQQQLAELGGAYR